jgi:hypothetical protein
MSQEQYDIMQEACKCKIMQKNKNSISINMQKSYFTNYLYSFSIY